MGSSNVQFSILMASYSLNNTWTPFVGGLLAASKLGTAWSSIIATSVVFCGQAVLLGGRLSGQLGWMATGLFIFGLGVSPLAVVQETIIVRFFSNHGLGVSLALGLLAGKTSSFVAAFTSYPLSARYGPHAPFLVATLLCAFSVGVNALYVFGSKWLADGAAVEQDIETEGRKLIQSRGGVIVSEIEAAQVVAAKKSVRVRDLEKLGDIFWVYILMNFLSGAIWSTFTHLAANIIENRYGYSEAEAGRIASLLHAGSIVLYPICGFITDYFGKTSSTSIHMLFLLSSVLTLGCYIWLVLPPSWTESAIPAVVMFGFGHGFATLLLVIIVPKIVDLKYVSTALGAHKSLEQTGSTISQTLAGLMLDQHKPRSVSATSLRAPLPQSQSAIQNVLWGFLFINVLQLTSILFLWRLDLVRQKRNEYALLPSTDAEDSVPPTPPNGSDGNDVHRLSRMSVSSELPLLDPSPSVSHTGLGEVHGEERRRGRRFLWLAVGVVVFCWMFFLWAVIGNVQKRT